MLKILKKEKSAQFAGSTHHPELAQKSEVVTKEELDELKKERELKEAYKNKANENLTTINAQIDTLIKDLKIDNSSEIESINNYITKVMKIRSKILIIN